MIEASRFDLQPRTPGSTVSDPTSQPFCTSRNDYWQTLNWLSTVSPRSLVEPFAKDTGTKRICLRRTEFGITLR